MANWKLIGLFGTLALGVAVSVTLFRAGGRAGEFTTLSPVFDGVCRDIPAVPGAEDMVLDRASGQLFVSSNNRRAAQAGQAARGALIRLPLDVGPEHAARLDATQGVPARFSPLGLGLHVAPDGRRTLMAVNFPDGPGRPATVEIFDIGADGLLAHRRTVPLPGVARPNDVAPDGPDSFYVTNESDLPSGSLRETMAILLDTEHSGSVWRYDGQGLTRLAGGLGYANSVALSPDGRSLYATATIGRALFVYARDPATGGLTERDVALVGTGLDNLSVEPDGRIWVAAHPRLMTWAAHARDARNVAPSQVLIIEPAATGTGGQVDQVLLQDGDATFSGASVAVRDGPVMVMGSVYSAGIRTCRLPEVWRQSQSHPAQRLLDPTRDDALKAAQEQAKNGGAGGR